MRNYRVFICLRYYVGVKDGRIYLFSYFYFIFYLFLFLNLELKLFFLLLLSYMVVSNKEIVNTNLFSITSAIYNFRKYNNISKNICIDILRERFNILSLNLL